MIKEYKCVCGKIFTNANAYNGHRGNCKDYYISKYGNLNKYNQHNKDVSNKAAQTIKAKNLNNKNLKLQQWISEKHVCECCGKVMTEYYGSGRFCSRQCANSRSHSQETKEKIGYSCSKNFNSALSQDEYISQHKIKKSKQYTPIIKYDGPELPKTINEAHSAGYPKRTAISTAETFWKTILDQNNITYKQNVPVWKPGNNNYWLDFLINDNIDLEIDGGLHKREVVQKKDKRRTEYLESLGYIVYRITWINPTSNRKKFLVNQQINDLLNFLQVTRIY